MSAELGLRGRWLANRLANSGECHVTPVGDLVKHEESRNCWCRPTSKGNMVVHHSFDGRELSEPDMLPEFQERPN